MTTLEKKAVLDRSPMIKIMRTSKRTPGFTEKEFLDLYEKAWKDVKIKIPKGAQTVKPKPILKGRLAPGISFVKAYNLD